MVKGVLGSFLRTGGDMDMVVGRETKSEPDAIVERSKEKETEP